MKKLLAYLTEQKDLYQILLEKACSKQEAIIQNNLETIEALNKEEEFLIREISTIETIRVKHIEENPETFGADALKLTLDQLKTRFPEGIRIQIDWETEKLMKVLENLKAVNGENAELLKQALRFVNVTINTIAGSEESRSYSKDKKQEGSSNKARNLIDRKI